MIGQTEDIKGVLEAIKEEEEEYRDNIPENLCGSEWYEVAEEAIYNLDEAIDALDTAVSNIESAQGEAYA